MKRYGYNQANYIEIEQQTLTKSIDNKFFFPLFTNYNKSLVCKQLKYRHLPWNGVNEVYETEHNIP